MYLMKKEEYLHLVEKENLPQNIFKNVITEIINPENEIKPYFNSENAVIFNRDCL